ncbi:MAG: hypothetical protein IIA19_04085 [Thaumarchaeota archaeon]|nr:hypothetical protein [Nitrososphaerota archaeon]
MSETGSKIKTGFKYIYLVVFFLLLAGVFYPLINDLSLDGVISGVTVLFVGLAGGILLYKSASSEKRREIYFGVGVGLIAISLALIFQITGRV